MNTESIYRDIFIFHIIEFVSFYQNVVEAHYETTEYSNLIKSSNFSS